ncbi:unnamed protein product [Cochlearia groenlandica]
MRSPETEKERRRSEETKNFKLRKASSCGDSRRAQVCGGETEATAKEITRWEVVLPKEMTRRRHDASRRRVTEEAIV